MNKEQVNNVQNMITIKFKKIRWAPHSKYGYASGRLMTICFNSKEECDEWVESNNKSYDGCTQYISLPYITSSDLIESEIKMN